MTSKRQVEMLPKSSYPHWNDQEMAAYLWAQADMLKAGYHKDSLQVSNKSEAKQKKEIIDTIMDILKNKAWTLREDGEMIYSELKERGYI